MSSDSPFNWPSMRFIFAEAVLPDLNILVIADTIFLPRSGRRRLVTDWQPFTRELNKFKEVFRCPRTPREKEKEREEESAEINKLWGRAPLCQGEKEGKLRAGDKGSETRGGKAERYNVMNLFMQYNLAHSDYNSAKFNWIVYSPRSRYDQSKREPRPRSACVPASFLFHPSLSSRRRETKEVSSSFLGNLGNAS